MAIGSRPALTLEFTQEGEDLIRRLSAEKNMDRSSVIRLALSTLGETRKSLAHAKSHGQNGTLVRDGVPDLLSVLEHAVPPISVSERGLKSAVKGQSRASPGSGVVKKHRAQLTLRSKQQVIRYSKIIIVALQEALDFDPLLRHNQPPPELRIEDPNYLEAIRSLVAELRRLNDLLESKPLKNRETSQAVVHLSKHFNKFLSSYAGAIGKGSGYLTVGVMASLLYHAGIGVDGVAKILSHVGIR